MRPLQVWLPTIQGSLANTETRRDRERAFRLWQGENLLWIIPGWPETVRWEEPDGIHAAAVRGEQYEAIRVFHVNEKGYVSGPEIGASFPRRSIDGLLTIWLDRGRSSPMFEAGRHALDVTIPDRRNGEMAHRTVTLQLAPGSFLPIRGIDEAMRMAVVQWPPEPMAVQPVSPEAESGERYRIVRYENTETVLDNPHPGRQVRQTLSGLIRWPAPLTNLFPAVSGLDDLFARDQMVAVAERSRRDLEGALNEARVAADRWLSEGQTTVLRGWLEPIREAEGDWGALSAADTSYGLSAGSLEEGLASPAWRDVLERTMHVGRVWGVPGLCWALLIDRLERGLSFRNCQRCGRLIQGRSHKRFCAREDDDECFRQRRAESRRRERRGRRVQ